MEEILVNNKHNFFELLDVLHSDDTITLTDSKEYMQKAVETVSDYCRSSNLKIKCDENKRHDFLL